MASVTPYIPQFITVHLGPPASDAPNVTVRFTDYIKNVASSEIFPTWEEAALRANILAQISFALNRVYTEFYPSRGYSFNITSSTATDQKYIQGRNIFENVSRLVDELFNTYIRRQGNFEPLLSSFCNGTTVTCDGMSQWGSQYLAQQGLNSVEILRRYYGSDIELVVNAPVQGILRSYPGTPLRVGSSGAAVRQLQAALNRIARNYPAIPRLGTDGAFGPATEEAVRVFQGVFGLAQDGVVGNATWYAVIRIYVAVTRLAELVSEGQQEYRADLSYPSVLQEGNSGEAVGRLQYMLAVMGQFIDYLPIVAIDSVFGPATRDAVRAFQGYAGLPQTGVVNRNTWEALHRQFLGAEAVLRENGALFSGSQASVPAMAVEIQQALRVAAALDEEQPAPQRTGLADRATAQAIEVWQQRQGLPATGSADAATRRALGQLMEDVLPGGPTRMTQYPGRVLSRGDKDPGGGVPNV